MADSAIVVGSKYKKVAQLAIVTGGKYKDVSETAIVTGGKYRKAWEAYTPPTFSDVIVNTVWIRDRTLNFAGPVINLSDLSVPLSHGYTKFRATIYGEVDYLARGEVYVGISMNGGDVYNGVAWGSCGSYHGGGAGQLTTTFNVDLDIASLISTYGSSGTIQFAYRGNDDAEHEPDVDFNASMTNIRVSKT